MISALMMVLSLRVTFYSLDMVITLIDWGLEKDATSWKGTVQFTRAESGVIFMIRLQISCN